MGDAMVFISVLRLVALWFSPRRTPMVTQLTGLLGQLGALAAAGPLAAALTTFGWTPQQVYTVMVTNYVLKVGWETVATPVTYRVVNFLKRAEHEDYYDRETKFTPFSLEA